MHVDDRVDSVCRSNDAVMRHVPLSRPLSNLAAKETAERQAEVQEQAMRLMGLNIRHTDICLWLGITDGELRLIKGATVALSNASH